MNSVSTTKQQQISHPLEKELSIQDQSTVIDVNQTETQLISHVEYDNKDDEIEQQLQEVYDLALDGYQQQSINASTVEGKYKARVGEVAAQFLNTALGAVREKNLQKKYKDKNVLDKNKLKALLPVKNVTNNNLVVADRNEILKMLSPNNQPIFDQQNASAKKPSDKKTTSTD